MSATSAKSQPSAARARLPHSPHGVLSAIGVLGAVAAAWAGALWQVSYLSSIGDPDRGFLLEAAGIAATTVALLLVSLLGLWVLRAPVWLYLPPLAATVHLALVTIRTRSEAFDVPRDKFESGTMSSGVVDALMPHAWPLLLVVIAAGAVATDRLLSIERRGVHRPRAGRARRSALAAAVLLAALNGAVTWWGLIYFLWYTGDPDDYRAGITAVLTTAALLVLGGMAARSLGAGRTTDALVVVGVLVQLGLAAAALDGATASADPESAGDYSFLFSMEAALLMPGSYPIVIVIVVAVVRAVLRGRSHPTPR